jgi:Putative zinc-finger
VSTDGLDEHDEFAEYDGAYILGALSDEERDAFEAHLIGCERCQAAVAELADLPGLLATVPAADFPHSRKPASDPVVTLLATARARRRRQRWFTAVGAAAAAAVIIVVTAVLTHTSSSAPKPTAAGPALAMSAVVPAPIHATVQVTPVAWGTSIRLQCTYDEEPTYPNEQYTLVVRTRAGQTENLGTWGLVPGKVTNFPAGTALHKADIKSIAVDTADGTTLLQLQY